MRKSYFISILAISMVLGITGCGNNTAAVATEAPAETIEYQGEGAVQGGIKSEDELAALEAEGEQYEQYTEPEATEEATPEVAETSTGSTNIEDYWQGSEYFDLLGYLKNSGSDDNMAGFEKGGPNDEILNYQCTYGTRWELRVTKYGIVIDCYREDHSNCYMVYVDDSIEPSDVVIDKFGTTFDSRVILILDETISHIKNNIDSNDPLAGSNLHYVPCTF